MTYLHTYKKYYPELGEISAGSLSDAENEAYQRMIKCDGMARVWAGQSL